MVWQKAAFAATTVVGTSAYAWHANANGKPQQLGVGASHVKHAGSNGGSGASKGYNTQWSQKNADAIQQMNMWKY